MRFWNPLPHDGLLTLLREMPIPTGSDVLDYGCGQGEVSLELANCFQAHITGVDPNPNAIARCRTKMLGRFFAEAFQATRFDPKSFDLIVNIGASPGLQKLLEEVTPLLRRPGRLLVGDIYWRRRPSEELRTFLGEPADQALTLDVQQAALVQKGFVIERTLLATDADWDRYEDEYDTNMVAHLEAHPEDPDFDAFESRRRAWRAMYLKHARGTMGFALYQSRLDE